MKLLTFRRDATSPNEVGVLTDAGVLPLTEAGFTCMIELIRRGGTAALPAVEGRGGALPLDSIKLSAPIPRPPKVICIGLNYRDHAIESNMAIPAVPTVFNKFPHTVIAPGEQIVLPQNSEKPDYEAEFAVVIGKGGRHIQPENWEDAVFGYTIVHDVSARDKQMETSQWLMGKTFDTFCPMGPWIVTKDEIPDPHNLDISLTIDGETLQSSNTRELIFKLPQIIAHLSSVFTLEPGDIIATGTPAGVGFARKPPRFLRAGDHVTITVQGIGQLTNPVVAEA